MICADKSRALGAGNKKAGLLAQEIKKAGLLARQ